MLAEIGGYVGLLLGISLFNVSTVNNHIIDLLFRSDSSGYFDGPKMCNFNFSSKRSETEITDISERTQSESPKRNEWFDAKD